MEQGGSAVMEMNPVMIPELSEVVEPSLFNDYADTEITLFGITGTLRELKGMCPVDEDKMTPEAIDRFAAQALTMSGVEVPERYSYLREEKPTEHDKSQHQREAQDKQHETELSKQVQAEKTAEPRTEETRTVQDDIIREQLAPLPVITENIHRVIIEKPAELPAGNDGAATGIIAPLAPLPPVRSVQTEQAIRVTDLYTEEESSVVLAPPEAAAEGPTVPAETLHIPAPVERIRAIMDAVLAEYGAVDPSQEAVGVAPAELATNEEVLLPEPSLSVEDGLNTEVPLGFAEAEQVLLEAGTGQSFAAELFDEERKRSAAIAAEIQPDPELVARQRFVDQHEWTLEIANTEPELVFEDFTESLFELAATADTVAETEFVPAGEAGVEPVPPVCKEVAEKLIALDPAEKQAVFPVVKSVAEAVQEVRLLQTAKSSPEEVVVATERLKELVIELFDAIGIEYDDEKIEQFVQTLLHPEFMPAPNQAQELDLENMGTHEVKRHFPQLVTTLTDFFAGHPLRTLGMFALFRENPGIQSDILAADTWSDSPATVARWYNKANA